MIENIPILIKKKLGVKRLTQPYVEYKLPNFICNFIPNSQNLYQILYLVKLLKARNLKGSKRKIIHHIQEIKIPLNG